MQEFVVFICVCMCFEDAYALEVCANVSSFHENCVGWTTKLYFLFLPSLQFKHRGEHVCIFEIDGLGVWKSNIKLLMELCHAFNFNLVAQRCTMMLLFHLFVSAYF